MATEVKLGRLNECTFEQALELKNRGFEGYYFNMQTSMEKLLDHFSINRIRPELSIVAWMDGKLVGFVWIGIKSIQGRKLAWNGGTGVFPEYRGKGIAKAMMLEMDRVIREQQVDKAILEVVTQNAPAIAAYQRGGFRIVDQLIGLTHSGALEQPLYDGDLPEGWRLAHGRPADVKDLPFYREQAAWGCMWHNIREGASLILHDQEGQAIAYTLFKRQYDEDEQVKSITVHQCEALSQREDRERIFRILLSEVYGSGDQTCDRTTSDLSMSNPEVTSLLQQAGFSTKYTQYLMTR